MKWIAVGSLALLSMQSAAGTRLVMMWVPAADIHDFLQAVQRAMPGSGYAIAYMTSRTGRIGRDEPKVAAYPLSLAAGGLVAAPDSLAEHPDAGSGWQAMKAAHTGIQAWGRIGALADLAHAFGYQTGYIGGTRLPDSTRVGGYMLMADRNGHVDHWDRADVDKPDPNAPFGIAFDPVAATRRDPKTGLLTIEDADFLRWHLYRPFCTDAQSMKMRSAAVARFADVVAHFAHRRAILVFVGGDPSEPNGRLVPVMMISSRTNTPSLLASASTRIPGLLSGADFLPTMLNQLSLPIPRRLVGRIASIEPTADPSSVLFKIAHDARDHLAARVAVGPMPLVMLVALLIWTFFRSRLRGSYVSIRAFLFLLLFLGALFPIPPPSLLLLIFLPALIMALVSKSHAGLILGTLFAIDWLLGSPVGSAAAWGPDPASATRFYGVSNQTAAAGVACWLAGTAELYALPRVVGLFVLSVILLKAGVNAGAAASCFFGAAWGSMLLAKSRSARFGLVVALTLVGIGGALGASGHIGRIVSLGAAGIIMTAFGKLRFNLFATFSEWGVLLIASLIACQAIGRNRKPDSVWLVTALAMLLLNDLGGMMFAVLYAVRWAWLIDSQPEPEPVGPRI